MISALVFTALALGAFAMAAVHLLQPTLDPFARPVSFYLHGDHGWLLPIALGAFGIAAVGLSVMVRSRLPTGPRRSLAFFGWGMLITALAPSDRWFPWESDPTIAGLIHATVAIVAPVLLLDPMISIWRRCRESRVTNLSLAAAYFLTLLASGTSLAIGLFTDRSPPLIGLAERLLALAAFAWLAAVAAQEHRLRA